MKQLLSTILVSTMVLSTMGTSFARENPNFTPETPEVLQEIQQETLGDFTGDEGDWFGHAYQSSGEAYLWKYLGSGGDVTVPSTFGGQPVVYIEFSTDVAFTSLTIPNTVRESHVIARSIETYYHPRSVEHGWVYADTISTIYYEGTEEEFKNKIWVNVGRGALPTIYYNSTMPSETTAPSTPEASTYPDWATSFVDFVSPQIMPDISVSNYNDPSNRGLIAQSFYNMYGNGVNVTPSHNFTDVGEFGAAIAWCHGNGVMSGTGNTIFGTVGNVNREQFCLILKQMATLLGKDTVSGDVSTLGNFSDGWSISQWAKEGVAWATANNLMAGSNGALNPHGDVTRLEVAIMLSALSGLETVKTPLEPSQGTTTGSTTPVYGAPTESEIEAVEYFLRCVAGAGENREYPYDNSWELR